MSGNERRYSSFGVEHQIEQIPNPTNGFSLSGQRNQAGRLMTDLAWQWDAAELDSVRSTQRLFGAAIDSAQVGRFEPTEWKETPLLTTPGGAFHPTGATRMSATPASGAVDVDVKVHGVRNLYVAGSSVFPTGGYANPTLTLLALAIRLAGHLNAGLDSRLTSS